MGLLDEIVKRFGVRISPGLLRSRAFWTSVGSIYRKISSGKMLPSDRIATGYFFENAREVFTGSRPVVWASLLVPSELIHGSGGVPFYPELSSALLAGMGLEGPFLECSQSSGFSAEICSFHRVILGAYLEGFFPDPSMFVSASLPCDSANLSFSYLSECSGAPHITVDVPAMGLERDLLQVTAEQLEMVSSEIGALTSTARSETVKNIKEAISLSNEARRLILKLEERRKACPSPLNGWDALGHLGIMAALPGTKECVAFYEALLCELENGELMPECEESKRILWMHLKPYYPNELKNALSRFGAVIVCEEYNRCYWEELDPSSPFVSLADKVASAAFAKSAKERAQNVLALARDYCVDGAVHFGHRGCRQSRGSAEIVRRALSSEGVKTLLLDGECVDGRESASAQLVTRLEAFLESLSYD